jgi:LDH2 family malate/lactate/ureidoglycolate dehydrogenase
MAGVEQGILVPAERLQGWTRQVFERVGVGRQDAALVADSLVEANLRGVDTHGITRVLVSYVRRLQGGAVDPTGEPSLLREAPSTALLDGRNGLGQVTASHAMRLAIAKARTTGVAFVATTRSNHYGAAAYWAMRALPEGMIGLSATNALPTFAPSGGRTPMLGTNPFAVAIPAGRERPMVLDMATTVVARGRIILHAKQGMPLAPGWAYDAEGRPTTDPQQALRGLLAPLGGTKGYGIALAIDMLCGVMTGAGFGTHFPAGGGENTRDPRDVGGVFAAIRVAAFTALEEFQARMDTAIRAIRACDRADGVARIYIPGEIEFETKAKRLVEGIPVPEVVVEEFRALGLELGAPFPLS